jgi:D-3-phosphoglycerate dehydrogenase
VAKVLSTSRSLNALPGLIDALTAAGHQVSMKDRPGLTEEEMVELARGHDAMIVGVEPVTARVIEAAPALQIVARPGVGYDKIDVAAATKAGVRVTITPGANAVSVADHTLALILACARRITEVDAATHVGGWPRTVGMELDQRTLGLIGYGGIGREVARRALAFGITVLATDPYADPDRARAAGVQLVSQDELLERADVISLHVPATPETVGMVDRDFLDRVRPGALLVNTARGELVDELAVARALDDGQLGAVGLDVFNTEPPAGSPLLGRAEAILTPHVAAYTEAALHRMADMAVGCVIDALAGRVPSGLVNPEVVTRELPETAK